jgi:hypothetical protein
VVLGGGDGREGGKGETMMPNDWSNWSSTGAPTPGESTSTGAPRRHGNSISEMKEKRIVELDEREQLPRNAIAERLGITVRTIQKYLSRHGRPMKCVGRRAKKLKDG